MADLKVDSNVLRGAAADLARLSNAAHELADSHVRAARLAPALGLDEPAQAVDSFLNSWAYGIRWLATQSDQIARDLRHSADTFDLVEARLAQAAAGGDPAAASAALPAPPATLVEAPLPMVRHWTGVLAPPMQLAHATRADQLIPGDPEQVKLLQRLVAGFAEAAYDARWLMKDTALGGWTGAAAQAVEAELLRVRDRLAKAEEAFENAQSAITGYYTVHADAQAEAAEAIKLWQSAILASQVARGVVVGEAPAGAPADPDAVLARAGAMARDAEDRIKLAGKTLAEVLHEAKEGAPKDPGFWAHVRRGIASFGEGLFDGTVTEPIEGVVGLSKFAVAINPARAIYDPDGYVAAQEALYAGIGHVLTHPKEFGAQIIDVKGWEEDPIRTFGKFLPDLLAIGAAMHAGGLLKGAEATERIETGTRTIKNLQEQFGSVYKPVDATDVREILEARGIEPSSAVGGAMRFEIEPPYGAVNDWKAVRLEPGQKVAVIDNGRAIVPFDGELPTDARQFTEQIHLPPAREVRTDSAGTEYTTRARLPEKVEIFEVRSSVDAAQATMLANTQFGAGGGTRLFVPDAQDAIYDDRLFRKLEGDTHYFRTDTLDSRVEDPAYRAVDPTYQDVEAHVPVRALDPATETRHGRLEALWEKGAETVRDNAVRSVAVATKDRTDGAGE